jgi:hypothetical protein
LNLQFLNASSKLRSSSFKKLGRASIASISVLLILLVSASCALAWPVEDLKITPESPLCTYSGNITITGKVGPGDTVTIVTTYVKELNVTDGKYEYDAGIVPIPAGTTLCSITAENVKDMTITTNLWKFIPISKTQDACNGKATMSVPAPYIPKGNYSLVIDGNAISTNAIANCNDGTDTSKTVKLTFVAKVDVKADEKGYFKQVCCTKRPAGEYTLKVGDKTTTVTLVDCDNEDNSGDTGNNGGADATNTTTSSGGTGNAAVSSGVGTSSVGNATVNATVQQSVPDTSDYGPEDVPDVAGTAATASATSNSFIDYINAILNWLGF